MKQLSAESKKTVIFTSATLFVDGTLDLFANELLGTEKAVGHFEDIKTTGVTLPVPRTGSRGGGSPHL